MAQAAGQTCCMSGCIYFYMGGPLCAASCGSPQVRPALFLPQLPPRARCTHKSPILLFTKVPPRAFLYAAGLITSGPISALLAGGPPVPPVRWDTAPLPPLPLFRVSPTATCGGLMRGRVARRSLGWCSGKKGAAGMAWRGVGMVALGGRDWRVDVGGRREAPAAGAGRDDRP